MLEHVKRHAIKADVLFLLPAVFLCCGGGVLIVWDLFQHEKETGAAPVLNPVGLLLVGVAIVVVLAAALTLGKNYSSTLVIREGHELVVHGIYRIVRHPIYLGTILCMLGLPIAVSSWSGLPPMLLLIPLFLYRIRIEERLLLEEFGDDYLAYMKRTKRLIPLVY